MQEDKMITRLFNLWMSNNKFPEEISREHTGPEGDTSVIRFKWFSGKSMDFGYTPQRYDYAFNLFQDYWKQQKQSTS